MKTLVIGIDGATRQILERMPMPYLHSLLEAYKGPELEIDLLSRGWAEQLSGAYACENKGFYILPKLDGTHRTEFKFSLGDMLENPAVKPLWTLANENGASVGIMNVPTTFPAPKVDGFFVSGAGGGLNKVEGVPEEMCWPRERAQLLENAGYVVDLRLGTAGLQEVGELFDKLEDMASKRINCFAQLCDRHSPDFGFIAFRQIAVLEYLAMWEFEAVFEGERQPTPIWGERLRPFFERFDRQLKKLVEDLNPEHLIFSSDHGVGPMREFYNPNAFLVERGYQNQRVNWKRSLVRSFRRKRLQRRFEIDWSTTRAFADWYSGCIYLNDEERFGGIVSNQESESLACEICDEINKDERFRSRGFEARPYRCERAGSFYERYAADIQLFNPEAYFVAHPDGPMFERNPNYGPVPDLSKVRGGMHSGNKTPYPFFCTDPETAKLIRPDDKNDLTLVYKLVERIFSSQG